MLIKKTRCIDEPELNDDTNMAVKTLIQSFPVITEQQLMSMEEWLSNSTDNIHALVCIELSYIFFKILYYMMKTIF